MMDAIHAEYLTKHMSYVNVAYFGRATHYQELFQSQNILLTLNIQRRLCTKTCRFDQQAAFDISIKHATREQFRNSAFDSILTKYT